MSAPPNLRRTELERVRHEVRAELLNRRDESGVWRGRLASSALATAVACTALELARRELNTQDDDLIRRGLSWLAQNANADGGWGDTVRSRSNLPTTLLARSALFAGASTDEHHQALERADGWILSHVGSLDPLVVERTVVDLYGKDRTFSVPILTLCTLAGTLPQGTWHRMPALPFELAVFPQSFFRFLGLPVVSYALPALIAVGQVQHHHRPRFPFSLLRQAARRPTLSRLRAIQPSSGGYLEAIPLTAFVTLSLVGAGEARHPVVESALDFLRGSVREDGDWPIDIDLATWVSTLSVQALAANDSLDALGEERETLRRWLLHQQYREIHPFTGAAPGGWAWTDLPGGVPDADDTPGALLALHALAPDDPEHLEAAEAGLGWLLGLQNRDGGLPTFCRGWGRLPFDASSPDLTAHFLRAAAAWRDSLSPAMRRHTDRGATQALRYLERIQRPDGSWVPLWFGNEHAPNNENPTYGTGRVLRALHDLGEAFHFPPLQGMIEAGTRFLLATQHSDGGWGGAAGTPPSLEESALAVDSLAGQGGEARQAREKGIAWLIQAWDAGTWREATPIGFYFANLWYFEDLYPLTFLLAALGRGKTN